MVLNITSLERFSVMAHLKGKKGIEHDPKSFQLSFGICSRFQMGSVPYTRVTEGGCALILTTKCHCSLIMVEQSEVGVFGESSVGQLGEYDTL